MANPAVEVNARFSPLVVMGSALCVFLFVCAFKKLKEGGKERGGDREREADFMAADGKREQQAIMQNSRES